MKKLSQNAGFSVLEFLFAIVIATIIGFVITLFAKDVISLNTSSQSSMTAQLEGRKILSVMVAELRSIIPSALGSYPIESAATSSVAFFADVDFDDVADKIRYFLDPATMSIKRGVILATGSPPAYTASETFVTLITNVISTSTPIFDYYSGDYDGTSGPLTVPIDITAVRLIKVTAPVIKDPHGSQITILTSQAALRNLKDNI